MIKINYNERGVLIDALTIAAGHWKANAKEMKLRKEPLTNDETNKAGRNESNAMYAEMLAVKLKDEQT